MNSIDVTMLVHSYSVPTSPQLQAISYGAYVYVRLFRTYMPIAFTHSQALGVRALTTTRKKSSSAPDPPAAPRDDDV